MFKSRSTSSSHVWPIDCGPADILRRHVISAASETATDALEDGLRRPVALIDKAATRTSARGVARIDAEHRHARERRLVSDLLFQIEKCPAMQRGPLAAMPNRYPVANAVERFERDGAAGALGLGHDAFADAVVHVAGEQRFLLAATVEQPLCGLGPFALEFGAQAPVAMAQGVQMRTAEVFAVGIRSDVDDTKIDAEHVLEVARFRLLDVANGEQIEITAKKYKIAFALPRGEQSALSLSGLERDFESAADGPDRDYGLVQLPGKDAVIIGNCAERLETALALAVGLIGVGNFNDGVDSNLSRERKSFTDGSIGQAMQGELAESLFLPRDGANRITSFVDPAHGHAQRLELRRIGGELDLGDQLHIFKYSRNSRLIKLALLLGLKAEAPAPRRFNGDALSRGL